MSELQDVLVAAMKAVDPDKTTAYHLTLVNAVLATDELRFLRDVLNAAPYNIQWKAPRTLR